MRIVIVWILMLCLVGCFSNQSSISTYNESTRTNQNLNYQESQSSADEYINRIAKRLMAVSERTASRYTFKVEQNVSPELVIDNTTNSITISDGLLHNLQDEAQLAALLSLSMARLDNVSDVKKSAINNLYMAGIDPRAVLELEQEYANSPSVSWLQTLFGQPPTALELATTSAMIDKLPKGLQRGQESYTQFLNGQ